MCSLEFSSLNIYIILLYNIYVNNPLRYHRGNYQSDDCPHRRRSQPLCIPPASVLRSFYPRRLSHSYFMCSAISFGAVSFPCCICGLMSPTRTSKSTREIIPFRCHSLLLITVMTFAISVCQSMTVQQLLLQLQIYRILRSKSILCIVP